MVSSVVVGVASSSSCMQRGKGSKGKDGVGSREVRGPEGRRMVAFLSIFSINSRGAVGSAS